MGEIYMCYVFCFLEISNMGVTAHIALQNHYTHIYILITEK